MLHSCYRRTGGLARVGEPDDRALSETAEGLREPEVGRSGEGGSSPGMGTRVRSPSTTKARGPGETTRCHGPRHVRARDNGVIPLHTAHGSGVFDPIPAAARHRLPGVSDVGRFAPAPRRIPPPTLKPTGPRPRPRMAGTPWGPRAPPRAVALIIGASAVLQRFHRLFGGEYSGSGCYIVVTAGREGARGLGNPMTEPFPRRPRVLGSPRSVALAKEGVPPEWEPGCGAPRRRRPVGRERQPGATGHVTSGRGHRTRRGGAPRVTGWALAAGSPKARVVSPAEGALRAP